MHETLQNAGPQVGVFVLLAACVWWMPAAACSGADHGTGATASTGSGNGNREIQISSAYGFAMAGYGKVGCWTPVRVRIAFTPNNPGDRLEGTLELLPGPFPQEHHYIKSLHMAGRGTKELEFSIIPSVDHRGQNGYEYTVAINTQNGRIAETAFCIPAASALLPQRVRLVLAFTSSGSLFIPAQRLPNKPESSSGIQKIIPMYIPVTPGQLPYSVSAYAGVSTIIWYDPVPGALSERKAQSIREFVRRGGHLVLAAGPGTRFTLQDWPELPAEFSGMVRLKPRFDGSDLILDGSSAGLVTTTSAATAYPMTSPIREITAHGLRLVQGKPLAEMSGTPVLARSECGIGRITMLGIDINDRLICSCPELRADILARAMDLPLLRRHLAAVNTVRNKHATAPKYAFMHQGPDSPASIITRFIQSADEMKPLPFRFVMIFILLFFALAGPINYFVLKAKRRLTWTWICFAATSLLFTAITYAGAIAIKGNSGFIREVEVVDLQQPGQALRSSFFGVFSPRPRATAMKIPPATIVSGITGLVMQTMRYQSGELDLDVSPGGDYIIEHDGGIMPAQIDLRQWKMETFHARNRSATTWELAANLKRSYSIISGTITNRSQDRLDALLVITGNSIADLGPLPPDGTCRIKGWTPLFQRLGRELALTPKISSEKTIAITPDQALAISFPLLLHAQYLLSKPQSGNQSPVLFSGSMQELVGRFISMNGALSRNPRPLTDWRVLDAAIPGNDQYGLDLSRVVCEGGVVILGIAHTRENPGTINFSDMNVKRNSYTLVRMIVPGSAISK